MKLSYDVKMPNEVETAENTEAENRKSLMTRSSMQATVLNAMQAPGGGAAPAQPAPKTGWGKVN